MSLGSAVSINKLEIINSVLSILNETEAASKGSVGKLMGDKAELVIEKMSSGVIYGSNQPGYDLIGKAFIPELPQSQELKYEVKLRRQSVTSCHFEKSKIGKFDVGIVIWYNEITLQPISAFAIEHSVVEELCLGKRAYITPKVCRNRGTEFTKLLESYW